MDKVRIGVVGIGNIGSFHVTYLSQGKINGAVLGAVCDLKPDRLEWARSVAGQELPCFEKVEDMMDSGLIDAIIIAVPHYFHPPYAIMGFEKGLHVMSEKPAGVYTKQVREMNEAAAKSGKVFGIMFNQRTTPIINKLKSLLDAGELGELKRMNYTMTDMYRTQAYYNSGGWRGTWSGEGGGVMMNQAPHNIDIWQRLCGVPKRVRGFCYCGKNRVLECEDEVTAYVEYENGATGVAVFSTSEPVATNRIELVGTRGKIVCEDESRLTFYRTEVDEREFNASSKIGFAHIPAWTCEIPFDTQADYHMGHPKITQNFVNAILHGEELISPGYEGIKVAEIVNAIYLSSWLDQWVEIPVDEELYYAKLQEKIANSTFEKTGVVEHVESDMTSTF